MLSKLWFCLSFIWKFENFHKGREYINHIYRAAYLNWARAQKTFLKVCAHRAHLINYTIRTISNKIQRWQQRALHCNKKVWDYYCWPWKGLKAVAVATAASSQSKSYKWLGLLFPASVLNLFTGFAQPRVPLPPLFNGWGVWWDWGWSNLVSFEIKPGLELLLVVRTTLGGDTGPTGPFPAFIVDFSLSFLFFLQITSSPGWVKNRVLLSSLLEMATPGRGFWGGLGLGSTSFISFCRLPWPLKDGAEVEVDNELENVRAFRASRKSVSGNAIFKISKKRSCTFLASDLTCS